MMMESQLAVRDHALPFEAEGMVARIVAVVVVGVAAVVLVMEAGK